MYILRGPIDHWEGLAVEIEFIMTRRWSLGGDIEQTGRRSSGTRKALWEGHRGLVTLAISC